MTITDHRVFGAYAPIEGRRDELVAPDGTVRAPWEAVASVLDQIGPTELRNRRVEVRRLLRGDGVTYNVYDQPGGRQQPWKLDPLPLVWSSDEWAVIEQGVTQRAELLSLLLADLYGPRTVFRRRLVPPEAILAHPGYLRPLVGARAERNEASGGPGAAGGGGPGREGITLYGADIVRDADGYPVVVRDRTQAPSGAGYALENRLVVSRVMPSMFRSAHVHRNAPFFRTLRATMALLAPDAATDDPRVVVLTPGPFNESYFEHAFLASQLGYTLVEGGDLLVRRGRLLLQSLGGDEPVDAVIRRVDGDWCDPLELRSDSALGVPGLIHAIRRGAVGVANHLGAGALENPALMAYLPQLSHALLGQPLLLPQPRTWWCGDPAAWEDVRPRLDDVLLKPVEPWRGRGTIQPRELDDAERALLDADLARTPHRFTAQEIVIPSTAPSLDPGGEIVARPAVLRAFAVADRDTFVVMPGGLGRVAESTADLLVSNQRGALSKDVWVLASEPEPASGHWVRTGAGIAAQPIGALPSRTVENLYWLGRYAERAEGLVRLLRSALDRRIDVQDRTMPGTDDTLATLVAAVSDLTDRPAPSVAHHPGEAEAAVPPALETDPLPDLLAMIVDPTTSGTLAHAIVALNDAADAVRDQLSGDSWLALDSLARLFAPLAGAPPEHAETLLRPILAEALVNLLAFAGLGAESMVRDPGWAAMDLGRRIERLQQLLSLLRTTLVPVLPPAVEGLTIESTLIAAESVMTYRRRYRSHAQVASALDLLLLDEGNPRSAAFQLEAIERRLDVLPRAPRRTEVLDPDQRLAARARTDLRVCDTRALADPHGADEREGLRRLLLDLGGVVRQLSEAVERVHFTHLQRHPLLLHLEEQVP